MHKINEIKHRCPETQVRVWWPDAEMLVGVGKEPGGPTLSAVAEHCLYNG